MDVEVEPLNAQATAEVLSQNIAMFLQHKSSITISKPSQPSTIPASSRSLIVKSPSGFSAVTKRALISSGHSSCQTQYLDRSSPGVMTPPAPNPHASVKLT